MNALHQRAVDLWIHFKRKDDPTGNPASGIIFAITNFPPPTGIAEPANTVELCEALNSINGLPPLTGEEQTEIQMYGAVAYLRADAGLSPIRFAAAMGWANRLAYVLGFLALAISGFS